MTSVLVTGAGGFIGCRVARALRRSGYEIYSMVRTDRGDTDGDIIQHDLRTPVLGIPGVDWVLHLAGGYAGADATELARGDRVMAHNLLQWGVEAGVKNWILASAAEVYGDVDGVASEGADTRPVIPYGCAKLETEGYFRKELNTVPDSRLVILRIAEVYGSRGKLMMELKRRLSRGFCPWPGNGDIPVSFVHVEDVAEAFVCAVRHARPGVSLYNVADDAPATWRQFLTAVATRCRTGNLSFLPMPVVQAYGTLSSFICRLMGREPILTRHALRLITTPKVLSNDRIKNELGFRLRYVSYLDGMEEALGGISHHA